MERNCEPMNQIRGVMDQGEQAHHCKAFVVKMKLRRSGGSAVKDADQYFHKAIASCSEAMGDQF